VPANLNLSGSNKELRFYEGANYVGFEAPALSADKIWVLPAADGTANQVIKTDGSGNLGFVTAESGLAWQTIVTGSTLTAVAGRAYWINTSSNACTITLPSSASNGDEIIFADYARTWGTNKIIIDSNGLNYQGQNDTYTVEYNTSGETINIVYSGATNGWIPLDDDSVADVPVAPSIQRGIFAFGNVGGSNTGVSNLMNSSGVIATDVAAVGTAHNAGSSCSYGGDKAIFGFGDAGGLTGITNLVNNSGVIASNVAAVGTARGGVNAASYDGSNKGIFFGGDTAGGVTAISNLISTSGVVASDTSAVGGVTARRYLGGASFGGDKAIFAYGRDGASNGLSMSNLVSNSGVIASDVTGVGTARVALAAVGYGGDKAVFAYGENYSTNALVNTRNLVSNIGVVAADATGAGTARNALGAAPYGGDKGAFGFGYIAEEASNLKTLVSNTGVVSANVTGVGTARYYTSGAGYSFSA
jgi:hypothetical protein